MTGFSIKLIPPLVAVEIISCLNFLFLGIDPRLLTFQPWNPGLVPFDHLLVLFVLSLIVFLFLLFSPPSPSKPLYFCSFPLFGY
jgi:hypothetical protein